MSSVKKPTRFLSTAAVLTFAVGMITGELRAEPVISEFMAANSTTLADADGSFSDWIEIHNPDASAVSLAGWHLTDSAGSKTKWQFPAVTLAPGAYLVVFASNKNRTDPTGQLHTNFALSAGGEYLGLVRPDGSVAFEYAPEYPAQTDDVAYGLMPGAMTTASATFLSPTPGSANVASVGGSIRDHVTFSRTSGLFRTSFNLELSGGSNGEQIRYVAASGALDRAVEVTAASPLYAGPIAIDRTTTVYAALFSADGRVRGPVATVHFSRLGADLSGFSSQLPVAIIDTQGSGQLVKDEIDHPSWLYVYPARGSGLSTFNGPAEVVSPLTVSVRGSSSADFPKKGYNVKFTDSFGAKRSQGLLDMPAYEKWAFVAPWSFDLTYVNNAFAYALSNRIGRWAPRTRFVEAFTNSGGDDVDAADYAGIYVVTDRIEINEGRLGLKSLSASDRAGEAVTGGYLLKIDPPDADEVAWRTLRGVPTDTETSIVLVSPKADDVAPEQLNYIQNYVQRMEDALHSDRTRGWAQRTYLDYIDRASWVDHHLLNTYLCNPDALIRSAYFHKERGGKLMAGPIWDFDRAMGSHWDNRSARHDTWFGVGGADVWQTGWWGILAQDPEFMQDWVDRWQSLRRGEFSSHNLATLFDSFVTQIGDAAALRDATRWPDSVSPYGNHTATSKLIRDWLVQRADWIDSQFLAAPRAVASGNTITFTPPSGAQLVYTIDGSDPRSLGGDIAPNAEVASGPITVAATANIHVRSYRSSLRGVFPGSPWSSAIGGDSSSPLSPSARLVNISSRAIVGSGENALIAGVVVADTEAKRYLSRAIGPGLGAFGASGFVADPQLSIYAENGSELFRNNGWEFGPDAAALPSYSRRVGAFPLAPGSADSALASSVGAGAYTVQITTPTGQNGVGLAELYELDSNGRTVNLSTRAYVHTGDGVLIGGFVVSGPAYKRMLIRAVGPTLGAFGLGNALADPILTIYSGTQTVASNDRWGSSANATAIAAASTRAGAFALSSESEDAAMLITLPPGAYTVEVRGKANSEGVALLEIYEIP